MRLLGRILIGLLAVIVLLATVMHIRASNQRENEETYLATLHKTLTVSSSSFPPNGDMPVNCTCKGKEVSPTLAWAGGSGRTKSYVILTTDYDVPTPAFPLFNLSHWVVYDLPASVGSLPEAVTVEQMRMLGGKIGNNSTGNMKYIGPCPPLGRHAYVFRVYALDAFLRADGLFDKQTVSDAMKGHVLGYGELTGYFQ